MSKKLLTTNNNAATLKDIVEWQEHLMKRLIEHTNVIKYIREPILVDELILEDTSEHGLRNEFPEFAELDNEDLRESMARAQGLSLHDLDSPENRDVKAAINKAVSHRMVDYLNQRTKIVQTIMDTLEEQLQLRLWALEAAPLITSSPVICYRVILHLVAPRGNFKAIERSTMTQNLNAFNPREGQSIQSFSNEYCAQLKVMLALGHKETLNDRATWFISAVATNAAWHTVILHYIDKDEWYLDGVNGNHNVTSDKFLIVVRNVTLKINQMEEFNLRVQSKKTANAPDPIKPAEPATVQVRQTSEKPKCAWCSALGQTISHTIEDCYQFSAIKRGVKAPDNGAKLFRSLADVLAQGEKPKFNAKDGTFQPATKIQQPQGHTFVSTTSASNQAGLQFLGTTDHGYCAFGLNLQERAPPGLDLSQYILLDCGCDQSTFGDSTLVVNKVKISPREIRGIGAVTAHEVGETIFGQTLVLPDQKINLLSQSQLVDGKRFNVQYNEAQDAYVVYDDMHTFEFTRLGGLYAIPIDNNNIQRALAELRNTHALATTTVGQDMVLPAHARDRLIQARRLHVILGHPSDAVLSKALDHDLSKSHLTSADVRNMTRVLGPCQECIQGKSKQLTDGGNYSPARLPGEVLHMDLIQIPIGNKQNISAIIAIDEFSSYGVVKDIVSKTSTVLLDKLMEIVNWFRSKGAYTTTIRTDPENAFRGVIPALQEKGITLDTRPVGQHEKHAESRVATLRDRMRAMEASMPFYLPTRLFPFLLRAANRMINMVPSTRTGHMSPYTMIHEERPEIPQLAFGETVLVTDPAPHTPTNNRDMRADLAIFLGLSDTSSTSGNFLILATCTVKQRALSTAKITTYGPHVEHMLKQMGTQLRQTQPDTIITAQDRSQFVQECRNPGQHTPQDAQPTNDAKGDANLQEYQTASSDKGDHEHQPASPHEHYTQHQPTSPDEDDYGKDVHSSHQPSSPDKGGTPQPPSPDKGGTTQSPSSDKGDAADENPHDITNANHRPYTSRAGRKCRPTAKLNGMVVNALLCSLSRDIQKFGQPGIISAKKEIGQILSTGSLKPTPHSKVTADERDKALECKLFIEAKRDGRIKSRFVGGTGASSQDKHQFPDLSSPTVRFESVALLLKVSAQNNYKLAVADVPGAYLHAEFQDLSLNPTPGKRRFVRVRGELAKLMGQVDSNCKNLTDDNGVLYLQLQKALYGLIESAKLWYAEISNTLTCAGFNQYTSEPCAFNHATKQIMVAVYVDDIIIFYQQEENLDWFLSLLERKYGEPRVQRNTPVDYLNVSITRIEADTAQFPRGTMLASQKEYIKSIKEKYPEYFVQNASVKAPYGLDLFASPDSLPARDAKMYVSVVMSLVYTCTRGRPDIFLPISYLCTKAKAPTQDDERKLRLVCTYLLNTIDLTLAFTPDSDMKIVSWIDASYAIHQDAKGHTGVIISMGNNKGSPIFLRSRKQKLVTRSSTESELVALHDASPQVVWTKAFLKELLIDHGPATIMQDNRSTMHMAQKGSGNFHRTKHIAVRYFAIKQLIETGVVKLQHAPSEEMLADPLTKPIIGKRFEDWRNKILFTPDTTPSM